MSESGQQAGLVDLALHMKPLAWSPFADGRMVSAEVLQRHLPGQRGEARETAGREGNRAMTHSAVDMFAGPG